MALTVSGPGLDLTLPSHYSHGAALSRAINEAQRGGLSEASYYVRRDGDLVGRVDRESGLTLIRTCAHLDREAEDANLEGEPDRGGSAASRPVASEASSTRRPGSPRRRTKEENEVPQTKKTRSSSSAKKRSAITARRSSRPTVAPTEEAAAEPEVGGEELYDALLGQVREAVEGVQEKPNESQTYTRLLVGGKAFAYIFPPRKGGVALKIPKQLLGVERELPAGHGFKVTGWGLTRTVKDKREAPAVAKALAVAATAVGEK